MNSENRQDVRYADIGRVDASGVCALPGVLDDISLTGCKVHFPIPVVIDMENDFELKIKPAQKSSNNPFVLVCHPQWIKENNGETEVGFKILRSPDTPQLASYIEELEKNSDDPTNVNDMIIETKATFI